jgi:voltage-gated potassium channel Kch
MITSVIRFLRREGRFVFLLATFLLLLGVGPYAADQGLGRWFTTILFTFILLASLYAVGEMRRLFMIGSVACALSLGLRWLHFFHPTTALAVAVAAAHILFMMSAAIAMLCYVLGKKRVTFDTISAALCVYLFFGLTWSVAYSVLEFLEPGSFLYQGQPIPPATEGTVNSAQDTMQWAYYSYITLTTLGYGDIVPATPKGRGLAVLEAVVGQLYLTVLVARLVGLHIAGASEQKER